MTRCLSTFVTLLVLTAPSIAQTPTDFSGTWTLDETRSVSPTHEGYVGPVTWVIKQSPKAMIVDITRGGKQFTLTYRLLDKQPAVSAAAEGIPSYRGYWEGNRLITETAQNIQGQTVTTREVVSLVNGGREMLIDRVVEVEHGYTLRRGQNYSTGKDYFTRVAP